MKKRSASIGIELRLARKQWSGIGATAQRHLEELIQLHSLSITHGDLIRLENRWYVTHTGLLGIARRHRCAGIRVQPVRSFCDAANSRWVFKATVFKTSRCRGFTGFGDADPSNVSPLVRGAEMRVAETRAVNRALRKAFGIGICSVEEIGSVAGPLEPGKPPKKTAQPANGNADNGQPLLRDRLCQLIHQHQLDPVLVKSYALEFSRVKTLKDASREQIENFIRHLADWAEKDKNALLCQLNTYLPPKEGAA